ncbi:5-formyltetrahydrofolate cyclo-ligase [Candidatus Oscillochloris fontis]|uniref:5-formyltetrahydrofolate cyclo-ligase n=1 Tax=Candidatus Oscillochloris fontis TaxID=2496868 RepID=UPI00101D8601|nr:5-formyltetrahydrofolate cyclo-ligase [Candidatus Oscillochloris fontis]
MNILAQKRYLRRELLDRRAQIVDRELRSAQIVGHVLALPAFLHAHAIHCYLAIGSEVATYHLIAAALTQGKAVVVPVVTDDGRLGHSWIRDIDMADFTTGSHGTLIPRRIIPALPGDWDLTFVPLLGFDPQGYRIGYGKGYYDQLLTATPAYAVGLAFQDQACPHIPHEPHDRRLNLVVTESGAREFAPAQVVSIW